MDTVYRDDMVAASSWVWAKDALWEAKARLCVVRHQLGHLVPRLEVLCTRLNGLHWSPDLNEKRINELIQKSKVNEFLDRKPFEQMVIEAAICLVHTILHEWASQNVLGELVRGKEYLFPSTPNLPPGMSTLSTPYPAGPVGYQGYVREPFGGQGAQGYQGFSGRRSNLSPPPSPVYMAERSNPSWEMFVKALVDAGFTNQGDGTWKNGKGPVVSEDEFRFSALSSFPEFLVMRTKGAGEEITTAQVWEVRIPPEYVAPSISQPSMRWRVVVIENYGDGIICVEHKPDRLCSTTIRYTEFEETVRMGRMI